MNMINKCFLLLFAAMFMASPAYSLSNQNDKWADDEVIANGADGFTKFYEIENFNGIDFTVLASAGSGTITVQYASDKLAESIIDDVIVNAFAAGTPSTLFGSGITKFYARLKISCTVGPCTYDGWFTAKGAMY